MVDFFSLGSSSGGSDEDDPRKIFNGLVKPEGVNELYASQSEVLDEWHTDRNRQDTVIKLPTGGGKSLVGLLIAQSTLNELKKPVVYLAPTKQLIKQVCDEASRFGIAAEPYSSAKEGIPNAALDGRAVCVASYDAIFNGRSVFGTSTRVSEIGELGALILDDAHAAFESVWDSFTFTITSKHHLGVYQDLCARFRKSFEDLGRAFTFDDVVSGRDYYILEVPFWEWISKIPEIGAVLQAYGPDKVDTWAWQHVRDELATCHALISREAFSIVPILPFTDKARAFATAKRRIYMSATIANDSELVRTFGARASAVSRPIVAPSLAGVGERMILAPALTQLPPFISEKQLIDQVIIDLRSKSKNTLILTRSFEAAKQWAGVAQVPSKGEDSEALLAQLKMSRGIAVVAPRRYDGIDLPGEECRLLVLDGLPYGASDYDRWRMSTLSTNVATSLLSQRIEQAIGRGSRGTSDYCAVILTGRELVNWLGRTTNQAFLSSSTKKQLEIGITVSGAVGSADDFKNTIWQCLNRDQGWRQYHAKEMASAALPGMPDVTLLELWEFERRGVEELRIRRYTPAISAFDEAIGKATDAATKGWFHQLKARASQQSGEDAQSDEWQSKAYRLNMRLTPPKGRIQVVRMDLPAQQAAGICAKLSEFTYGGVALTTFDTFTAFLNGTSTANQFESAMQKLFDWLGFASSRPDQLYKQGPDILVLDEAGYALVIEAKSCRKAKNKFTKTMHGQVLSHENWFNATYSPQAGRKRIVIAATADAEANAGTSDTGVLTFAALAGLVSDARTLLSQAVVMPKDQCLQGVAAMLGSVGLDRDGIIARLVPFSDAD